MKAKLTPGLLLVLILLTACSPGAKNESPVEVADTTQISEDVYSNAEFFSLASYLTNEPADPADVQQIDSSCIIVITPTMAQMDAMTKEYGDELESVVDDAFYYQGMALDIIDSLKIKSVNADTKSFLKLNGSTKSYTLNIRKPNLPAWNIVFFHKDKEPEIVSAVDITVEKALTYFSDNH